MKKVFFFVYSVVCSVFYSIFYSIFFVSILFFVSMLGTTLYAETNYDKFLLKLKNVGIHTSEIQKKKSISRYELARLLNASECHDCFHPDATFIRRYTEQNWNAFVHLPGKNFSDIASPITEFLSDNYFYCVAYVAENTHMQGYSEYTSPICASKFCGFRNVNRAEFYQVLLNLIDEYLYDKYVVNWEDIYDRYRKLDTKSYEYLYLDAKDRSVIEGYSQKKEQRLSSVEEFQTYTKYCMFNLSACGLTPINDIPQGFWPISQINILLAHDILDDTKISKDSLFEMVSGEEILRSMFAISSIATCEFDDDYDKDGILNADDNCPLHFNPHQRDMDKDGIGDVCDDDLDNDGIKNSVGIVDDTGKIDISKLSENKDNCIFVYNPDQRQTQDKTYGDACVDVNDRLATAIQVVKVGKYAPMEGKFHAQIEGKWDKAERKFSDGGTAQGEDVSHTFLKPGVYTIDLKVSNKNHEVTASTSVFVGKNPDIQVAVQNEESVLIYSGQCVTLSLKKIGVFDKFRIKFDDILKDYPAGTKNIKYCFPDAGTHTVTTTLIDDDKVVGISVVTLGTGPGSLGGNLTANTLSPKVGEKVLFSTAIAGFAIDDVKEIVWDFGDGNKQRTKKLFPVHNYDVVGPKIVKEKILLYDGRIITMVLTLYVVDPSNFISYYLAQDLKKLFWKTNELVTIFYHEAENQKEIGAKVYNGNWRKMMSQLPEKVSDRYFAGKYIPTSEEYLPGNIKLTAHSTFWVDGDDACTKAAIENKLSDFKCDMDSDGIPDLCDTDIDGDGIPNPLNILVGEPKNCKYTKDNINTGAVSSSSGYPGALDNCFLVENKDQKDSDEDGIGDACDNNTNSGENNPDTDGDGISDVLDYCPLLPETYNTIVDGDGCPEIPEKTGDPDKDKPIVGVVECNSCPCNYIDFADDLFNGANIQAKLYNINQKILYDVSSIVSVDDF